MGLKVGINLSIELEEYHISLMA